MTFHIFNGKANRQRKKRLSLILVKTIGPHQAMLVLYCTYVPINLRSHATAQSLENKPK